MADRMMQHIADIMSREEPLDLRMKECGFNIWHTGGGCFAYGQIVTEDDGTLPHQGEQREILITDQGGGALPDESEAVYLGVYDDDGQELGCWALQNIDAAIAAAEKIKAQVIAGEEITVDNALWSSQS